MKTYVLDTHALVWFLALPEKLGRGARRALSEVSAGRAAGFVPVVTLLEVSLLRERRRTRLHVAAIEEALRDVPALRFLDMDSRQAREYEALSVLDDPFDRMLVAAARSVGGRMITADGVIGDSGLVQAVWD